MNVNPLVAQMAEMMMHGELPMGVESEMPIESQEQSQDTVNALLAALGIDPNSMLRTNVDPSFGVQAAAQGKQAGAGGNDIVAQIMG